MGGSLLSAAKSLVITYSGYLTPEYIGVIALPVLAVSLMTPRKSRGEWFLLSCLIAIPVFDLVGLALRREMLEHLGFLKSFNFERIQAFIPFVFAANVAVGVSYLQHAHWSNITTGALRKGLWALLWISVAYMVVKSAYSLFTLSPPEALPQAFPYRLLVLTHVALLVYAVFGASLLLFLTLRGKRLLNSKPVDLGHALPSSFVRVAFLLTLLIFVIGERAVDARITRLLDYGTLGTFQNSLEATPALSFLTNEPNPQAYRTISIGDGAHPNRMMFHRLYAADGYENIYPLRYHELFGLLTAPYLEKDPEEYQYFHGWGNRAYAFGPDMNFALASLMGIRWFYARNVNLDSPELTEVFNAEDPRVYREKPKVVKVYENNSVFPRAFVVHQVRTFSTRVELLDALSKATFQELRAQAYVLEADVPDLTLQHLSVAPSGLATITRYEPDRVTVEVDTPSPAILVLTDVNAPGWVSRINAEETRIFTVYNVFRGVTIPAGHSQITYTYSPKYTYVGGALILLAAILTGLWIVELRRRKWSGAD